MIFFFFLVDILGSEFRAPEGTLRAALILLGLLLTIRVFCQLCAGIEVNMFLRLPLRLVLILSGIV